MRDFEPLKNFMNDMVQDCAPCMAVEVYLKGEQVFRHACGYANWEERIPLNGSELYNIYSCSKIATVTAVMQLIEQGKCRLDDPLYDYIPEYKNVLVRDGEQIEKAKNVITLWHLLTMTAGMSYDLSIPAVHKAKELTDGKMDTLQVIRCLAEEPLSFEPGTQWQYGLCHDVLGAVVEVISGMKFRDYMQKNIFEPLQMGETCYHHTPETVCRTAEQYRFVKNTGEEEQESTLFGGSGTLRNVGKTHNFSVLGEEYDSGGAGIITSIQDYGKFLAALANYGMGLTGERIISRQSIERLCQNELNPEQLKKMRSDCPHLQGYGYGLGVRIHMNPAEPGLHWGLHEFGWDGAASAYALIDPEIGLAVFCAQHLLNSPASYAKRKLKDTVYRCL